MSSAKKLFLVVLGGRCKGCHVEQHDVRWVVGETINATLPALRQEWIGIRRGFTSIATAASTMSMAIALKLLSKRRIHPVLTVRSCGSSTLAPMTPPRWRNSMPSG